MDEGNGVKPIRRADICVREMGICVRGSDTHVRENLGLAAVWPAHSHQVNNSSAVLLLFYPIQLQADFETAAGLTALRKRTTG